MASPPPGWLSTLPESTDIVWANFPSTNIQRFIKMRPAIVLLSGVDDKTSSRLVTVAYGTSKGLDKLGPACFIVTDPDHIAACGLSRPTKFDLNTYVVLDWNAVNFQVPVDGRLSATSSILGTLPKAVHPQLFDAYSRSAYKKYREEELKRRGAGR